MGSPDTTLPKQCGSWPDLKAAYRLLSNPRVEPAAIQRPHRERTLAACNEHKVVLCVQDTSDLDLTSKSAMRGRGKLGGGTLRGLLQHTALAVAPAADDRPLEDSPARLLGVLHQTWYRRAQPEGGETLRELQARATDADVWQGAASAVAGLGDTSARLIHVGDRHCDIFRFFAHCRGLGHGFVVRARYDRTLVDEENRQIGPLFDTLAGQPEAGRQTLTVHEQRTPKGVTRCRGREVELSVRFAAVTLRPPVNDPRTKGVDPVACHAVMVRECDPCEGEEGLQWVVLTSEAVGDEADAWRVVRYYRHRWLIEEWHRVLKEGCRIEGARFDDAEDVKRLAAIKSVVAVRLLQLRDLAQGARDDADSPARLRQAVPDTWVRVVAAVAKVPKDELTPKQFYLAIAKRGGYLARRRDPRPGWKVLWRGWHDIQLMTETLDLMQTTCG